MTIRARIYDVLELGGYSGRVGAAVEFFLILLILANAAAVTLQSVSWLDAAYGDFFTLFEQISLAVFTVEYITRIWVAAERDPKSNSWSVRLRYLKSPFAVIDLLAIFPSILFTTSDLTVLRVFRLLRLLKLVRYSPALTSLIAVVYAERLSLLAAYLIMLLLTFVSAVALNSLEQGAAGFETIPEAMWWSIVTLTTVGYGDVVPQSDLGRIVAAFLMLLGVGFFAMPIGIIASGFTEEIHKQADGHLKGRVPSLLALEGLNHADIHRLSRRGTVRSYGPGEQITRSEDIHDGIFLMLSGEALLKGGDRQFTLTSPDYVGDLRVMHFHDFEYVVFARRNCKFLWLSEQDFAALVKERPKIMDAFVAHREVALGRLLSENLITPDEAVQIRELSTDYLADI